jgi:hypothetical protein
MKQIKVTWSGGETWDPETTSSINPEKKKSVVEHLIETGGQTIDEAITAIQKFSVFSLDIKQEKPADTSINWITLIDINETDKAMAEEIEQMILEHYSHKQSSLKEGTSGYTIEIESFEL